MLQDIDPGTQFFNTRDIKDICLEGYCSVDKTAEEILENLKANYNIGFGPDLSTGSGQFDYLLLLGIAECEA